MFQKKKQFWGIVLVLLLWMVGCSAPTTDNGTDAISKQEETVPTQEPMAESTNILMPTVTNTPVPTATNTPTPTPTPTNTPTPTPTNTPTPTPTPTPTNTPTPTPTPVIIEELDEGYVFSLMSDVADKLMAMADSGEISGYKWGTSKFLVWKYASTNIAGPKVYKFAIMNCLGEYETEFVEFEKEVEYPEYNIEGIGDDIFKLRYKDSYEECFNAKTYEYFPYPNRCIMITPFSDGYMLVYLLDTAWSVKENSYYGYRYYYYCDIAIISESGEVYNIPLAYNYVDKPLAGKYSEGYFFLENAFYNIKGEKVLDLSGVKVANEPYFDEGCCWIEYKDSGAMWGAYIDIQGDFLAEPMKLYDLY